MPAPEQILALIAATLVLAAIPGPSVAIIVARTLSHGRPYGLATVLGTNIGVGLQLLALVAGLLALAQQIASVLFWVKWLGVAYLLYIGVRTFLAPPAPLATEPGKRRPFLTTAAEGFAVALINPKTLLFNAALLMQFVDPAAQAGAQLLILGAVFLVTLGLADCGWVLLAAWSRGFTRVASRWPNRVSGACLSLAAVWLAFSRRGA